MKDIVWYEWKYAVTRDGRVWSYPKKFRNCMAGGRFLVSTISKWKNRKDGYLTVKLWRWSSFTIHSLVANAFVPNPDNLPCIDHDDNDKLNNNDWNLKWLTYANNNMKCHKYLKNEPWQFHAKKIGRFSKDWELIDEFPSVLQASAFIGWNKNAIANCARGNKKSSWGFIWKYL